MSKELDNLINSIKDDPVCANVLENHHIPHQQKTKSAFQSMLSALKLFVAMDNCNYELETMRRSGLFEQVNNAIQLAEKE